MKNPIKQSESEILNSICEYLTYQNLMFWRQNTMPIYNVLNKGYRAMPKYSMNGIPDIIIIKDGRFVGLEVKTKIGVQSKSQTEFQVLCELQNGLYFVVRSIDDTIHALASLDPV